MEIDYTENSNWLFDYGLVEDISTVSGAGFQAPVPATIGFGWPSEALNCSSNVSAELDCSFVDSKIPKETGSRKRLKPEPCNASGSKACREKLRRNKLNERFLELCSVLEPGRPPKTDKVAILSDAVRMLTQLRTEAEKLKESNVDLQEKIKELKIEKNELRDEKQRLKIEREKMEKQVKAMSSQQQQQQPGFISHHHHPSAGGGNKLMPFVSYPGVAMWQFMPPSVVDTSQDHVLRPPVA